MIVLNFLVGIVAGLLVPWGERKLRSLAESLWLGTLPMDEREFDLAALLVILMIAAMLVGALGFGSSGFMLAFGALVGLFGRRLWRRIVAGAQA